MRMATSSFHASGLVPVHVGQPAPTQDHLAEAESARPTWRQRRSKLVEPGIEWQKLGFDPRWLGMETSDCAAALDPSVFFGKGDDELQRFLAGARGRDETALVIATLGDVESDTSRSVLSTYGASVSLPGLRGSINGRRLPAGTRAALTPDLDPPDRDLGRRLLARPVDAPWWALTLAGFTLQPGADGPPTSHAPEGRLRPILVDALGDPLAATWTSPEEDQRWYLVPAATDWNGLLDWLIRQALPAYVPDALRRARSPQFVGPDLQTQAERAAWHALADLEARYAEEKTRLEDDLHRAQSAADPIRYRLLYGTGGDLVDAVDAVLTAAGFTTVNLDRELGGTRSADLLVTFTGQRRLVEVKSASGNASEDLVGDLQRHLTTWPELGPHEPVGGGVLIVNHQHRREPFQRSQQVYSRPEFVATLTMPVVSTRAFFDWWRVSDWSAIRAAVLGLAASAAGFSAPPPAASSPPTPTATTRNEPRSQWRPWRRGGTG
jgi:hypothetical protein